MDSQKESVEEIQKSALNFAAMVIQRRSSAALTAKLQEFARGNSYHDDGQAEVVGYRREANT
ncbi:hypothetical protein [Bradyrhizobium sp. 188]|uniref:hypothetical protein n=1 Tax=Bradyrhizobium sp. 188 TaxID=2782656 RepID=UPI001FFAD850|nr:hypothetical protein [Bradyrhizobium sp. 188]MCK1501743.1 hypothetical protein [Bradyrhizobium sp. 188]